MELRGGPWLALRHHAGVRVINAHGAAVKRYTPAVSRVAAFRATIRRSYIAKYNFVLPRMEMLYSGAYDLSRKNRTHTGARAERARARARTHACLVDLGGSPRSSPDARRGASR